MNVDILIPIFLGCIGILQGTINRQVSNYIGVAQATLIGNLTTVIFCLIFYYFVKNNQNVVPAIFQIKAPFNTYKWWFALPALFGFFIVAGMPFAISKLGAVKVTVGLIAAQMATSALWDLFVLDLSFNLYKFLGMLFAFLSVAMITLSK